MSSQLSHSAGRIHSHASLHWPEPFVTASCAWAAFSLWPLCSPCFQRLLYRGKTLTPRAQRTTEDTETPCCSDHRASGLVKDVIYSRLVMAFSISSWLTRPTMVLIFLPSRVNSMLVGRPMRPPNCSAMESLANRIG